MSKTLKTRPVDVRMLDRKDHTVGVEEYHNHEKGFCDLPARNIKAVEERDKDLLNGEYPYRRKETCYYIFSYKGANICGCKMCTGQDWRKKENRDERHMSKAELVGETKRWNGLIEEYGSNLPLSRDAIEEALLGVEEKTDPVTNSIPVQQ